MNCRAWQSLDGTYHEDKNHSFHPFHINVLLREDRYDEMNFSYSCENLQNAYPEPTIFAAVVCEALTVDIYFYVEWTAAPVSSIRWR